MNSTGFTFSYRLSGSKLRNHPKQERHHINFFYEPSFSLHMISDRNPDMALGHSDFAFGHQSVPPLFAKELHFRSHSEEQVAETLKVLWLGSLYATR
ncbi:MAG: hypothetical protein AAGE59_16975 [Cyanobacteria bacterium P01_F01_bin.86]